MHPASLVCSLEVLHQQMMRTLINKFLLHCPHWGAAILQSWFSLSGFCGGLPARSLAEAGRRFNVLLPFLLLNSRCLSRCFPFPDCLRLDGARYMRVWTFTWIY